jgi:hypothetical protein
VSMLAGLLQVFMPRGDVVPGVIHAVLTVLGYVEMSDAQLRSLQALWCVSLLSGLCKWPCYVVMAYDIPGVVYAFPCSFWTC